MTQSFLWYELMTSDPKAATRFYADVVGWTPQAFGGPHDYTVLNVGDRGVGGIMAIPAEAQNLPPCWVGYIHSTDIDGDVENGGRGLDVDALLDRIEVDPADRARLLDGRDAYLPRSAGRLARMLHAMG